HFCVKGKRADRVRRSRRNGADPARAWRIPRPLRRLLRSRLRRRSQRRPRRARSALTRRAVHRRGRPARGKTGVRAAVRAGRAPIWRSGLQLSGAGPQALQALCALALRGCDRMIRTLCAAFAAFILIGCSGVSSARDFPPNPALFVARDADSTMYLFGTLHLRRPDQPWGGPRAQAALAETQEVWTELEISPQSDAQTQNLPLRDGPAAPDHPLSSYFTAAENARIAAVAQRYGMQPTVIEAMKPWLAGITLAVLPMVQAGYDPNAGADRAIDAFGDA